MAKSDDALGSAFVSPDDGIEPFGGADFYVQIRAKELYRIAAQRGQLLARVEELEKLIENLSDG